MIHLGVERRLYIQSYNIVLDRYPSSRMSSRKRLLREHPQYRSRDSMHQHQSSRSDHNPTVQAEIFSLTGCSCSLNCVIFIIPERHAGFRVKGQGIRLRVWFHLHARPDLHQKPRGADPGGVQVDILRVDMWIIR